MAVRRSVAAIALGLVVLAGPISAATAGAESEAVKRGAYIYRAAGCEGCHTDRKSGGAPLAGGRPLKTPFGIFYAPNITPDPTHGIGDWTEANFVRALRQGLAPNGSHYFPAFPYPSYSGMTARDLSDLWCYLRTVKPVARANRPHDIDFPFGWRTLVAVWKWLNFETGPTTTETGRSVAWRRGAYLVRAVGHCSECHTPRGVLGGPKKDMFLAGAKDGAEGEAVPNITSDRETGIGAWSESDLLFLLQSGITRDGDVVGGAMSEVVEHSTSKLVDADRRAIIEYLRTVPAKRNRIGRRQP